jgi:four helix bundle protein
MKSENVVKEKSYAFALRIVRLYKYLCEEKKEYTLSKQVLRCGTAIGALVRESEHAESNADFIHKLSVSLKEANETDYWLNILKDTDYLEETIFISLSNDIMELIKLLTSIIKTCKTKK